MDGSSESARFIVVSTITVVIDEPRTVAGRIEDGRAWIAVEDLEATTGWVRKPEGLCQGDICVPVRRPEDLEAGQEIDLIAMAGLLQRRVVSDEAGIVVFSHDAATRRAALDGLTAPDFTLPTLDGEPFTFSSLAGTKRILVTFSSWCGCRYDLPGWQALSDELSEFGVAIVAVALDDNPEAVRRFTNDITYPVLLDRQHLLSELYAISNVPTVVWIDEQGTIVRPNGLVFGTDTFAEFTGVDSTPQLELLKRWVRTGALPLNPEDAAGAIADLSDEELEARLLFRLGIEAKRQGLDELAESTLRKAGDLAPLDFSVRRAAMPLLGEDPFGQAFLDLYDEWQEQGAPYHGLPLGNEKSVSPQER
jgi:peroxiredoxin